MAKANIYFDDQGRRRVDRSAAGQQAGPDPMQQVLQRLAAAEKRIETVEAENKALKAEKKKTDERVQKLASAVIEGDGFAGTLEDGITYNGGGGPRGIQGVPGTTPAGNWVPKEDCDHEVLEYFTRPVTPP